MGETIAQQLGFLFDGLAAARGKHWYVTDDRLRKLGNAYAGVIQYYAPVEAVGVAGAWWTAILATGGAFLPPLIVEARQAEKRKQAVANAAVNSVEEQLRRERAQGMPPGLGDPPPQGWGFPPPPPDYRPPADFPSP
jgi:hypothetical protein